jgi:hypothetical protein
MRTAEAKDPCKCESLVGLSDEADRLPPLIHRIPTLSSGARRETGLRIIFWASRDIADAIG